MKKRELGRLSRASWRLIVPIAVIIIGCATLLLTKAAQPIARIEAESGTRSSNVQLISNDSSASGNSAVRFASQTASGEKCPQLSNIKFCDDFDGTSGTYPDNSKWNVFQSGSSWGSHCWKKSPQNISMDGQGHLKMTIIDVGSVQCTDYYGNPSQLTSAGMDTGGGRFLTNKGKFEIRAKLSCATGVWGSIWTSGTPWPTQGEIDIWESMDGNLNRIKHTVHSGRDGSTAEKWKLGQNYTINERFCDKYRVYAAEWRDGYIQFMVDGVKTFRVNKSDTPSGKYWAFDEGQHRLLITFQYGNAAEGRGLPNPADLPTSMLIDYVRVYN